MPSLLMRIPVLALLVLGLSACATRDVPEPIHLDPALTGVIEIEDLHVGKTDSGLLRVHVTGRNRLDRVVLMNYQFDWLDGDGRRVDTVMAGKVRFSADRLRYFSIDGIAPNEEVEDFRLHIEDRRR